MVRARPVGSKNGRGPAARTPLPNGRTPLPNRPTGPGRTPLPNGRPSSSLISRDTASIEASQSSSAGETAQAQPQSATLLSSHSKPLKDVPQVQVTNERGESAFYGPFQTPQLREPRQPRQPRQPSPPDFVELSGLPESQSIADSDSDSLSDGELEAVTTLRPRGPPARFRMPPPLPSQKGTGKKGRDRQSRSRNTTPSIMSQSDPEETAYLRMPLHNFQTDEGIDNYGSGKEKDIPTSKELEALLDRLGKLVTIADARGTVADRGMRTTVGLRKERLEEIETERRDDEQKERLKKEALDEEERGRNKKASKMKKRKDASTAREERPLAHGAHGLAAQDGTHHPGEFIRALFPRLDRGVSFVVAFLSLALKAAIVWKHFIH